MVRRVTPKLSVGCDEDFGKDNFDIIVSLIKSKKDNVYEFPLPDGPHDYLMFKRAVNFVIKNLKEGKSVLIICQSGISRSVSVCIAAHTCHNEDDFEVSYVLCSHNIFHPSTPLIKSAKKYINEY